MSPGLALPSSRKRGGVSHDYGSLRRDAAAHFVRHVVATEDEVPGKDERSTDDADEANAERVAASVSGQPQQPDDERGKRGRICAAADCSGRLTRR